MKEKCEEKEREKCEEKESETKYLKRKPERIKINYIQLIIIVIVFG